LFQLPELLSRLLGPMWLVSTRSDAILAKLLETKFPAP
jgi:hypothetical protein